MSKDARKKGELPENPWGGDPELEIPVARARLVFSEPKLSIIDMIGREITEYHTKTMMMARITLTNAIDDSLDYTVIMEIRDSQGETISMAYSTGRIESLGVASAGHSFIIDKEGKYEVRAFAISNMENPQILSPVGSVSIQVDPKKEQDLTHNPMITDLNDHSVLENLTWNNYQLTMSFESHNIRYAIKGGNVSGMIIARFEGAAFLAITIQSTSNGELWLELPTDLMIKNRDSDYFAFLDGEEIPITKAKVNDFEILRIEFDVGAEELELSKYYE